MDMLKGFSEVASMPRWFINIRWGTEEGVKWRIVVPFTKVMQLVEKKLNLGLQTSFRVKVCKQFNPIPVTHIATSGIKGVM